MLYESQGHKLVNKKQNNKNTISNNGPPGGGGGSENEYVLGYEYFVDIFGGSSQIWTLFRSHFYAFKGLFLRSRYRMGIFLGVAKISNIFCRVLEIPDIFWVNSRCWARAYVLRKK